jgi:hypothetical protein
MSEPAPQPVLPYTSTPAPGHSAAAAPLPYFAGADAGHRRLWRVAPRRCAWLAAAWVVLIVALFLPGCDMSNSGNGREPAPTYVVYWLTVVDVAEFGGHLREGNVDPKAATVPLACAAFVAGSLVFPLAPLLLARRLGRGLRWLGWTTAALLLSPWLLLGVVALQDKAGRFLYGYYLLAAAYTAAFVVILLPRQPKS